MSAKLSIIVPTIGRRTLARTLDSIKAAGFSPWDEVIVVADGPLLDARTMWQDANIRGKYIDLPAPTQDFGGTPRECGISYAENDWLMFMDDDDWYCPSGFSVVRKAIDAQGFDQRPILFRMVEDAAIYAWKKRGVLACGNVSTQIFACPNDKARLGKWGKFYSGDYQFINETCANYKQGPEWREEIIARYGGINRGRYF